ncbi:MAG: AsmA family protein [Verrucomicrobia bacterium]|nr:AsmA family protein [Verrucomicrobiota bacterium]
MSATVSSAAPKRPVSKTVGIAALILVVLFLLAYFVATSDPFIRGFVLPRIGAAIHAKVAADRVRLSPFSSVEIQNLKITTTSPTPLLQAQTLRATYSLMDILRGRITISSLLIENGTVEILPGASGQTTLDPILKSGDAASPTPAAGGSKSKRALEMNVAQASVKNFTVRRIQVNAQGETESLLLSNVEATVASLATGKPATVSLAARWLLDQAKAGKVEGQFQSDWKLTLNVDGLPDSVEGGARASILGATGGFSVAAGLSPSLQVALTATECRQALFQLEKGGKPVSSLRAQGPLDIRKREARLKLAMDGVDRAILNALGASSGIDVGAGVVSASGQLDVANAGQAFSWTLEVRAQELNLSRGGKSTPALQIEMSCGGSADLAARKGRIDPFHLQATSGGRPVLQAALSAPMDLNWGGGEAAAKEATLELALLDVALADWRAWLGTWADSGRAKATVRLTAKRGGKDILIENQVEASDLSLPLGNVPLKPATLQIAARARLQNWTQASIEGFQANLSRSGQPAIQAQATGTFDATNGAFAVKSSVALSPAIWNESAPPQLLTMVASAEGRWETAGKLTLSQGFLALPPTPRAATNQVRVRGALDATHADALEGAWTLEAGTFDVTSLWEAFRGGRESEAQTETNAPIAFPRSEPAASRWPVKSIRCDVSVARLLCGDAALSDLVAQASAQGGQIQVKPLRCKVGDGAVEASAMLRIGSDPLSYEILWRADRIPIEGFVNVFNPAMRGTVKGDLTSAANVKGVGVTGANLRRSLAGNASLLLTNATILIPTTGKRVWILPLDLNRIAALLNLKELTRSPVTDVRLKIEAGQGRIQLEEAAVRSEAFLATAAGGVEIASDLGQSTLSIPIDIALSRELTKRVKFFSFSPPPDEAYSKLPSFVSLGGTLAKVETKTDTARIIGLTASAAVGLAGSAATDLVGAAGKTVGKAVGGLGNLLGARRADTNATTTNAPSKSFNLLNLFKKKQQTPDPK